MQPGDFDEREFQTALRGRRRISPVAIVLHCFGGCLIGTLVHLSVVDHLIPASAVAVGMIPLFGIACTVKILQGLIYVVMGTALGFITGLAIALVGWHRLPLAIGFLLGGVCVSVLASNWAASLDWQCAAFTGTL